MTKIHLYICTLFLVASFSSLSEARFRCFFGDWACSAGCKVLGQQTGLCDDNGKCWCSEEKLSLDSFKSLLPTRCSLGLSFCQSTCNAIGRRDGICNSNGCECSKERLTPLEFSMCAASSTCRLHCQSSGFSSGVCEGWNCRCENSSSSGLNEF